jgi:hypothetical protein
MLPLALCLTLVVGQTTTADLDVGRLNLTQARIEDVRLETPPTRASPAIMLGLGVLTLGTGVLSTAYVIDLKAKRQNNVDSLVLDATAVSTVIISIVGLALSVGGGTLLALNSQRAEENEIRREQVRARIAELEQSERVDDQIFVARAREALSEQRPSYGLPGGLLGAAGGLGLASLISVWGGQAARPAFTGMTIAGVGEAVVAIAMVGIAAWQFVARAQERSRIDEHLDALRRAPQYPRELEPDRMPAAPPPPLPPMPDAPLPPPPAPPPSASSHLPPAPIAFAWTLEF